MSAGKEFQMDGLQQKKRAEQVQSVSLSPPAAERRMNVEPELVLPYSPHTAAAPSL